MYRIQTTLNFLDLELNPGHHQTMMGVMGVKHLLLVKTVQLVMRKVSLPLKQGK